MDPLIHGYIMTTPASDRNLIQPVSATAGTALAGTFGMNAALLAYLSDAPESDRIAAVQGEFLPLAQMLDSMTGSAIVQSWDNEDLIIEAAMVDAGWL